MNKTIRWNIGILAINIGYKIRGSKWCTTEKMNRIDIIRWTIGIFVLRYAYKLRGDIPQKMWGKWVHI